ncbi:MAG: PilZ domain-containing protein [Desulfofustis sp.]|nr:PilZ domain-containing protein [Desulfofustis sp.]MBT8361239.1 PilZ domain-containing protein [Deltaproteobacteria bacterium]NNK57455.1 PilZ domain-containing protein [Desulfofustis sp.]RZW24652.1 MAG: PilZ domain-containing protein [Desulfobulbaceae bacterium]
MKTVNAFVNKEKYTAYACPHCQRIHRVPVAAQKGVNHKLVAHCKCLNRFEVILNFRQFYRKEVDLAGEVKNVSTGSGNWHEMVVADLSINGLRFKTTGLKEIKIGHRLQVKFTLDDRQAHEIEKEARVINISGDYYGCEFLNLAYQEEELGNYLFTS